MNLSEMEKAISEAEAELRRADLVATKLARILVGRLRKVDYSSVLCDLKRELAKFNMHTNQWMD